MEEEETSQIETKILFRVDANKREKRQSIIPLLANSKLIGKKKLKICHTCTNLGG